MHHQQLRSLGGQKGRPKQKNRRFINQSKNWRWNRRSRIYHSRNPYLKPKGRVPTFPLRNFKNSNYRSARKDTTYPYPTNLLRYFVTFLLYSYQGLQYPSVDQKAKKPEPGKTSWWGRLFKWYLFHKYMELIKKMMRGVGRITVFCLLALLLIISWSSSESLHQIYMNKYDTFRRMLHHLRLVSMPPARNVVVLEWRSRACSTIFFG